MLTPDSIITISNHENTILKKFIDNKVKNADPGDIRSFVLHILDQNVLGYLDSLKRLNLKRNLIEQELYDSARNAELKQLLRIETVSYTHLLEMWLSVPSFSDWVSIG